MEKVVLKIGGSCLTNASQIKKILNVLDLYPGNQIVLVFSAFGKTTDKLEQIVDAALKNTESVYIRKMIQEVRVFHFEIINNLHFTRGHSVFFKVDAVFKELCEIVFVMRDILKPEAFKDLVISTGEILSGIILHEYFRFVDVENWLLDTFSLVKTNSRFNNACVNEDLTCENIKKAIHTKNLHLLHGFIGSTEIDYSNFLHGKVLFRTTIGREGSDYTAALAGKALRVQEVVFFKNVLGIMDKDPNIPGGEDAKLIPETTYDRSEQLLSGTAKRILHENTIRVLREVNIPISVRSFDHLDLPGTRIC